ncbi:MAG: hypothetical protein RLT87_12835 [Gammaproteobacteria bacterium]
MTAIHHYLKPGTGLPAHSVSMQTADTGDKSKMKHGFADLLDIINPLQHIPLVGSIYRHITGDEIKPVMKIAGGALFGGPLGAAISVASVAFDSHKHVPAEIPVGGVDPATVADRYSFEKQQSEQLALKHASLPGTRTIHVNADIFTNNSQNPAAHVTFTSTSELVAGRQTNLQQSTQGLQRLLGVYDSMAKQDQQANNRDPVGAG